MKFSNFSGFICYLLPTASYKFNLNVRLIMKITPRKVTIQVLIVAVAGLMNSHMINCTTTHHNDLGGTLISCHVLNSRVT
jgi:hypothetical protein